MSGTSGQQLRGRALFERQKKQRSINFVGPRLIAIGIHTPQNAGSLFRLADSVAARELLFVGSTDILANNSRVLHKLARNTENFVSWNVMSRSSLLSLLGGTLSALAIEITSKSKNIFESDLTSYDSLICGSERHGIDQDILDACKAAVHIPMFGINGSMNVVQAMAVASFEWCRQKQLIG